MTNSFDAHSHAVLPYSPDVIWPALIDPAAIKQFLGASVTGVWHVGAAINYAYSWNGQSHSDTATILDLEPPRLLRMKVVRNEGDHKGEFNHLTFEMAQIGDHSSRVTVTQGDNSSQQEMDHARETWNTVLGNLGKFLSA